jgi:hypothetical protein
VSNLDEMFNDTMKMTRDWQSFWENRTAQMLEEMVKSQNFVHAMTRSLENAIDTRQLINSNVERFSQLFQIVSKKDLDALNRQVFDQSFRLEQVTQTLTAIQDEMRRQTELLARIAGNTAKT